MKPSLLLLTLIALASAAPLPAAEPAKPALAAAAAPSKAQADLQALVDRQHTLVAAAENAADGAVLRSLQSQFQLLADDYEHYLGDHPDVGAGYAAYALLLGRLDLDPDGRKRAATLLLKANELDPDQPLIKNQLGNYLAEDGKPLEAVNYYLAAIRLAPQEPLYHFQLGTLLTEARDEFLQSGEWTRATLDQSMQQAFAEAARLAPANIGYAYRLAESFYDLEKPDWAVALKTWQTLEDQVVTKVEKQTIRLHEANVLIKMGREAEARALLAGVDELVLAKQKQKLVDRLMAENAAAPAGGPPTVPAAVKSVP